MDLLKTVCNNVVWVTLVILISLSNSSQFYHGKDRYPRAEKGQDRAPGTRPSTLKLWEHLTSQTVFNIIIAPASDVTRWLSLVPFSEDYKIFLFAGVIEKTALCPYFCKDPESSIFHPQTSCIWCFFFTVALARECDGWTSSLLLRKD